jgi:hypothetical protein
MATHASRLAGALRGARPSRRELNFDLAVAIRRAPQDVLAFLADIQDAEPVPRNAHVRMVKDPAGTTRVGTRWHEDVRLVPGWWMRVESVVTDVGPRRLAMDFSSTWFTGRLTYEVEPGAGVSVLHQRETLVPRKHVGWLGPWMGRKLRPRLGHRLREIRRLLEAPLPS